MSSRRLSQIAIVVSVVAFAFGALGAWAVFRPVESAPITATTQGVTNFSTLQVDDGTTTVTAYGFTNDPNTGLNLSATAVMDFIINGSSVLSINSSGFSLAAGSLFDCNGVADCVVLDADGDTTISGDVDDTMFFEFGGTDILTCQDFPAAGASGDFCDIVDTVAAMDGSDTVQVLDVNVTDANHTGNSNFLEGANFNLATGDDQAQQTAIVCSGVWDWCMDAAAFPIVSTANAWLDDFVGDTIRAENVLLSGSDTEAVDPALSQQQNGVVSLVSGDSDTNCAADCSELALGLHWQADQDGLVFEARLHLDANILNSVVCVGLTDTVALEMFATIGGSDVVTTNATDGVAFCYDTAADTDEWFALGVLGDTDGTGNGATGTAPVADTYQTFRIVVEGDGAVAYFFIDGTLAGTVTANAVTATVALSPFVVVDANAAASETIDVDYLFVSASRN